MEHCRYTLDECLVLEEIQEAAIAEDEHIQSRDRWSVEDESDAASDLSDVWEEEDIQVGSRAPNHEGWVDDDDEKEPIDEESVADGLFWLRVGKEPGRPYTIDELEERLKGESRLQQDATDGHYSSTDIFALQMRRRNAPLKFTTSISTRGPRPS